MKYYLWIFTGIYTLTLLIFGLLAYFIDLSSSTTVPTLIAAGFFTWIFVKREQRVPNPQERKHLILGSIASNLIISAILVVIALFFIAPIQTSIEIIKHIPIWLWILVTIFLILVEYFIFHLSYGWYAKQCLKGLENKKHLN
jgi:amino acid transporter